jgi:protein arginine kinase
MNAGKRGNTRMRSAPSPGWLSGSGPESEIVVSTRIRLARNLTSHPFPPQATPVQRKAVYEKVCGALGAGAGGTMFSAVNFAGISSLDQHFLVERRIASPDLLSVEGDRGVAFDNAERVSVMINEEDHLRLQCLMPGCAPLETWNALDALDDELGAALEFAFEERRGFLTCCPTNSGTGLRVSFLVHLPALILTRSLDAVLQGAGQLGVAARGFFGEYSDAVGGFFQLSNQATMGAHEREFIASTERTVREIVAYEQRARQRLLSEAKLELCDKIYRAYGILAYARTLSVAEFMNCTSALRLGAETGLFTEVPLPELNAATLAIMPAHLQKYAKRSLDDRALSELRAERTRELFFKKRRGHGASRPIRRTAAG